MQPAGRRDFLKTAAAGTIGLGLAGQTAAAAEGGDDRIVVALIGPGGMGGNHLGLLTARKDVEVAYVCDVDQNRLEAAVKKVETATSKTPQATKDMRQALDDKKVDAVFQAEIHETKVLCGDRLHKELAIRDIQALVGKQASAHQNLAFHGGMPDFIHPHLDKTVV